MRSLSVISLPLLLAAGCFSDPDVVESGSSGGPGTTSASNSTSAGTTSAGGSSSTASGGTATSTVGSTTVDETTDEPPLPTTGDATTGGDREPDFFDDFSEDGEEVADWEEKSPNVFEVEGGVLVAPNGASAMQDFHDWFVYQAAQRLDVRVSVEFTITNAAITNEPFLVVRAPNETTAAGTLYTGYMAVAGTEMMPGPPATNDHLCIIRWSGQQMYDDAWCVPHMGTLSEDFVYRLTLSAQGEEMVELLARLERREVMGSPDAWEVLAEVTHVDGDAARLNEPGHWGLGGGEGPEEIGNYYYDNVAAYFL